MDPVANMLTSIRNGYMARSLDVTVPFSKFKLEIAAALEKAGFIGKVEKKENTLHINLIYENQIPKMNEIKRISKLGLRVYTKAAHIEKVKGGRGTIIVSTPKGVMIGQEAKKNKLGGEIICRVW